MSQYCVSKLLLPPTLASVFMPLSLLKQLINSFIKIPTVCIGILVQLPNNFKYRRTWKHSFPSDCKSVWLKPQAKMGQPILFVNYTILVVAIPFQITTLIGTEKNSHPS
jgi:hypothetical protein